MLSGWSLDLFRNAIDGEMSEVVTDTLEHGDQDKYLLFLKLAAHYVISATRVVAVVIIVRNRSNLDKWTFLNTDDLDLLNSGTRCRHFVPT